MLLRCVWRPFLYPSLLKWLLQQVRRCFFQGNFIFDKTLETYSKGWSYGGEISKSSQVLTGPKQASAFSKIAAPSVWSLDAYSPESRPHKSKLVKWRSAQIHQDKPHTNAPFTHEKLAFCWQGNKRILVCFWLSGQLKWAKVKVTLSCPTLCDPVDYIVPGVLQARIPVN